MKQILLFLLIFILVIETVRSQNVGIGTATPLEKLHINGSVRGNQAGALRISTGTGYVDVGPQNSGWSHFQTDRARFYFNKAITVDEGLIGSYDEDLQLQTSGTTRMFIRNTDGNVGIGTTNPGFKLHVPSGYIGTDYINTSDNSVGSGVTGVMVKAGDNFLRTGTPAAVLSYLGVSAPTGDNLGNHIATQALEMGAFNINNAIQLNSNGDHFEFMRNRSDDNNYEWLVFYSGGARQGIILYDGPWGGANSLSDEFSITAENGNRLTLNTESGRHISLMPKGTGNVGIGTTDPYGKLHIVGGHLNLGNTSDPSVDQGNNWLTWGYRADNMPYYAIRTQYKTYGAYTYSRLQLNWHTGVEIGASSTYGGTRFFNNSPGVGATQIMSIGDGDNHVRVNNYLFAQYLNTTDNTVGSGVSGIMVKAGDNYLRTANSAAVLSYLGVTAPTGDNLGNHTATTTLNMNNNVVSAFNRLEPYGIGGNSGNGGHAYAIFQEGGDWVWPYPDLRIAYHTGIKLGANQSYNGIRFYTDYDMSGLVMAVNDGSTGGAGNVYMTGSLGIKTAPTVPLDVFGASRFGNNTACGPRLKVGWYYGCEPIIVPEANNYGYIGGPNPDGFYRMYSYSYNNPSDIKLKNNINYVESNNYLSEMIMKDIDKIQPAFYKYNNETNEMIVGNENKFRPQMHLGVMVDNAPDYIKDEAFSAIEIYGIATLGIAGVKYNRNEIKEIKQHLGIEKNISVNDFGSSIIDGIEIWINYSEDFIGKIDNIIPVVILTSSDPKINLSVMEKTHQGFKVVASASVNNLSFDWVAMAKAPVQNYNSELKQDISSDLKDKLQVPEATKAMLKNYYENLKPTQTSGN